MAKLQSPRGTHDYFGENIDKYNHIIEKSRSIAKNFGFDEVLTPVFEFAPVFMKTLGDGSDIVNKEMYLFEDRGGDQLILRPEGTAGIARAFISNGLTRNVPLKWFYQGPMFRYERPQKGRTRQFHQIGVEILGAKDFKHDIDCMSLAHSLLTALLPQQKLTLEINSLGDAPSRSQFRDELLKYLTPLKNKLSEDSQKRLEINPLRILDSKDEGDQRICQSAPKLSDCLNQESQDMFQNIKDALENLEVPYSVNEQLVRGLDYYSHCVFEFKSNDLGAQNTVLAGGRYNDLIKTMGGPDLQGVGFAAGVERLMLLSELAAAPQFQTAVLSLDDSAQDLSLNICYQLRRRVISCEIIDSGNMSKKMKKADRLGASYAILLGSEEVKNNTLTLKDLKKGEQSQVSLDKIVETLLELKKGH